MNSLNKIRKGIFMYLVVMETFDLSQNINCIVAETEEKAQEYIDKTMEGNVYNGGGIYQIRQIKLYE